MSWLERHYRFFQATAGASAICASAIVLWFNVPTSRSVVVTPFGASVLVLPLLIFFVSFFAVAAVYLRRKHSA